jgi:hypothetical protein
MAKASKKHVKKTAPKPKIGAKPPARALSDAELEKVAGGAALGGATTSSPTVSGQAGWIEVNSFQWGVGRGISSPGTGSGDTAGSTPSVSEIVITKKP